MGIFLPGPGSANRLPPEIRHDFAKIEQQQVAQQIQAQGTRIADLALLVVWFLSKQPKGVGVQIPLSELAELKGKILKTTPIEVPDTTQPSDPETGRSPVIPAVVISAHDAEDQPKVIRANGTP